MSAKGASRLGRLQGIGQGFRMLAAGYSNKEIARPLGDFQFRMVGASQTPQRRAEDSRKSSTRMQPRAQLRQRALDTGGQPLFQSQSVAVGDVTELEAAPPRSCPDDSALGMERLPVLRQ